MIAIPVKTNDVSGIVSPTFGKGKYFAFFDEAKQGFVEENQVGNGVHVAAWFGRLGVKSVILSHLGEKPFHSLLQQGIKVYFAGHERINTHDVLAKFSNHTLEEVTVQNYMSLLGEEDHHHEDDHAHGHGGGCCSGHKH